MKARIIGALCAGLFSLGLSATADAALITRLGGLAVYDTDLDISWLADANAGAGVSPFDDGASTTDGVMSWQSAKDWAASLTVGGRTDWRLPTTLQPDASCETQTNDLSSGFNCTGSEMGHLFHDELGGTKFNSMLTSGDPDLAKFTNFPTPAGDIVYWSGTTVATSPDDAWDFNITIGKQNLFHKTGDALFAWAVLDGDIGAGVVPVPASAWLFGSALGLLGWMRRRHRA